MALRLAVVVIQAAGLQRQVVAGPAVQGRDEGALDGLLRHVEIAEHGDQRRDNAAVLLPEHPLSRVAATSSIAPAARTRLSVLGLSPPTICVSNSEPTSRSSVARGYIDLIS